MSVSSNHLSVNPLTPNTSTPIFNFLNDADHNLKSVVVVHMVTVDYFSDSFVVSEPV